MKMQVIFEELRPRMFELCGGVKNERRIEVEGGSSQKEGGWRGARE